MQPKPVFPRQLGPEAQQPTSRPLFRPAFKPRLGRFRPVRRRLPGAVDRLLSASDGHPRSSREQSHLRSVPPVTLDPFPFLPASLARTKAAAGGLAHGRRPWPAMAGDGGGRRRPAHGRSMLLPSTFLSYLSPSSLAPHHARSRESRPWRPERW
jgi:hypothetical protein